MAVVFWFAPMQVDVEGHQKLLGKGLPHCLYELEQVSEFRLKRSDVSSVSSVSSAWLVCRAAPAAALIRVRSRRNGRLGTMPTVDPAMLASRYSLKEHVSSDGS